jgi:hypothetical protein
LIKQHTARTLGSFAVLYLALIVPFFLGGYVLILVFSTYATRIQRLYLWGIDGLFTVVGGLGSVPLSLFFGFNAAIYTALALYALALLISSRCATAVWRSRILQVHTN